MNESGDIQPVLVLGDEARVTVTIARSLHRRGIAVDIATLSSASAGLRSRSIRRVVNLPDYRKEPDLFSAALFDLIDARGYDMLIPSTDAALVALGPLHEELSGLLHVACPPPSIVNRVLNKDATLDTAARVGVPAPHTYRLGTGVDVETATRSWRFPVIAKPRTKLEIGTFKVRRFETIEDLKAACAVETRWVSQCLFQEFVRGEGVGIEALIHRGKPLALFQHRRIREFPHTGGVSVLAVSEAVDPVLADYSIRLLQALEWEGVAMVEFRRDSVARTAMLMEVNGRYWGSIALSCLAGMEFPWYEWQLVHGRPVEPGAGYRTGMRMRWTSGSLLRLHAMRADGMPRSGGWGGLKELGGFITDFFPPTRDALWSLRDPFPGLAETGRTIKKMAADEVKGWLKSVLPDHLLRMREMYRRLGPRAGKVYFACSLRRALRLKDDCVRAGVLEGRNVLFVCHGNIIRSPMAAALLRRSLIGAGGQAVTVESAGLHANSLNGPDRRALHVAAEFGVSLQHHTAQPLTRDMVQRADVIFIMDYLNEADLLSRYPEAGKKLFLLGACGDAPLCDAEIPDPYHGGPEDIRRCYDQLRERIETLTLLLRKASEPETDEIRRYAGVPASRTSRVR